MIVNIRGTGGSGKSTAVKEVMARYFAKTPKYTEGRRQPFYYILSGGPNGRTLVVPGHYETPCGGCDTITKVEDVFNLVRQCAETGYDVLFEGIISQDDVTRTTEINRTYPVLVLHLATPIDVCLASIQARRDARGDDRPLSTTNTTRRAEGLRKRTIPKLKDNGVQVKTVTREEAVREALTALGWE